MLTITNKQIFYILKNAIESYLGVEQFRHFDHITVTKPITMIILFYDKIICDHIKVKKIQ